MRGRAVKRHRTRAKVERATRILRQHGWHADDPERLARRAKRFADSRWGCNCGLCANPRKLCRGKTRASLTLKEYQHREDEE